jgi:putative DNA-binding protein
MLPGVPPTKVLRRRNSASVASATRVRSGGTLSPECSNVSRGSSNQPTAGRVATISAKCGGFDHGGVHVIGLVNGAPVCAGGAAGAPLPVRVWRRLSGALAATFPVVRQLVGDPFFRAVARRYVRAG